MAMITEAINNTIEPSQILHGLALYDIGEGDPVFLMPYPHGFTTCSMAESPLARLLVGLGRRVITFDPPGAYRSFRAAWVDMPEMLNCTVEGLHSCGVQGAIPFIGHSMGGLCALAFTLEYPEQVNRLILVGSLAGKPARRDFKAMPWCWKLDDLNFWRFMVWGMRLQFDKGNLAIHKREDQLVKSASFVDRSKAPQIIIEDGDEQLPAPVRDRWPTVARKLDYRPRLRKIDIPTLILVGRFDLQTPVEYSQELAAGIPKAKLIIFENSGHSPFIEEAIRFMSELARFLAGGRIH